MEDINKEEFNWLKLKEGFFIIGRTYLPGDFYDFSEPEYPKQGHPKRRPGIILKKHNDFLLVSFFYSKLKRKMINEEISNELDKLKKVPTSEELDWITEKVLESSIKSNDGKSIFYPSLKSKDLMWIHKSKVISSRKEKELYKWYCNEWDEEKFFSGTVKEIYDNLISNDVLEGLSIIEQKRFYQKHNFLKTKLKIVLSLKEQQLKLI